MRESEVKPVCPELLQTLRQGSTKGILHYFNRKRRQKWAKHAIYKLSAIYKTFHTRKESYIPTESRKQVGTEMAQFSAYLFTETSARQVEHSKTSSNKLSRYRQKPLRRPVVKQKWSLFKPPPAILLQTGPRHVTVTSSKHLPPIGALWLQQQRLFPVYCELGEKEQSTSQMQRGVAVSRTNARTHARRISPPINCTDITFRNILSTAGTQYVLPGCHSWIS